MRTRLPIALAILLLSVGAPCRAADFIVGNQVGQKMADFKLDDQRGDHKSFYSVSSGKKTLVYYFMGCCNHCVNLLPKVSDLARQAQTKGFAIVGIQYFGNTELCKFSAGKHRLTGTVFADSKGEICGRMGVGEFATMVLDEKGIIRYRGPGEDVEGLKKALKA